MATFTALAKMYSTEYFCNTKVAGLGEIFVKWKFSLIRYLKNWLASLHKKVTQILQKTVQYDLSVPPPKFVSISC